MIYKTQGIWYNSEKGISSLTHFMPLNSFDTPWKHQKTRDFFWCFLGVSKETGGMKWVKVPWNFSYTYSAFSRIFDLIGINSSMRGVPIIQKTVRWFALQINGLVSIWLGPLSWKSYRLFSRIKSYYRIVFCTLSINNYFKNFKFQTPQI